MTKIQITAERKRAEASLIATSTIISLGLSSGEITTAEAIRRYGTWAKDAISSQRLQPSRIGNGTNATRWYSVADILALKAAELEHAEVLLNK